MLCWSEARSLLRVSHAGAGSQSFGLSSTAFPGHKQGAGREAGLPGLEPAPTWDPRHARQGLNHLRHRAGPNNQFLNLEMQGFLLTWYFYVIMTTDSGSQGYTSGSTSYLFAVYKHYGAHVSLRCQSHNVHYRQIWVIVHMASRILWSDTES